MILFLKDLLTADESAELLAKCQKHHATHVSQDGYPREYRNNYRAIFDDEAIAKDLFARILPGMRDNGLATLIRGGQTWDLVDLNPHWRYCYYETGGVFGRHRDTSYLTSKLTVMFYLNSDFEGGATRFYNVGNNLHGVVHSMKDEHDRGPFRDAGLETLDICGEAGSCVIFPHDLLHDGQLVTKGPKHILRTEAMFKRRVLS